MAFARDMRDLKTEAFKILMRCLSMDSWDPEVSFNSYLTIEGILTGLIAFKFFVRMCLNIQCLDASGKEGTSNELKKDLN